MVGGRQFEELEYDQFVCRCKEVVNCSGVNKKRKAVLLGRRPSEACVYLVQPDIGNTNPA